MWPQTSHPRPDRYISNCCQITYMKFRQGLHYGIHVISFIYKVGLQECLVMLNREMAKVTWNGWGALWGLLLGGIALGVAAWGAFEVRNPFLIVAWALAVITWAVLLG